MQQKYFILLYNTLLTYFFYYTKETNFMNYIYYLFWQTAAILKMPIQVSKFIDFI